MSKAGIPLSVSLYANPESEDYTLLYKHQWNTRCRWAFLQKNDIFKREWKDHCCYGYKINRDYHSKNIFKWNGLEFHWCLYHKILTEHYMAAWRYKISVRVLKNISLVRCAHSQNIFQHSKRNFVSPCSHVISSIYHAWLFPRESGMKWESQNQLIREDFFWKILTWTKPKATKFMDLYILHLCKASIYFSFLLSTTNPKNVNMTEITGFHSFIGLFRFTIILFSRYPQIAKASLGGQCLYN